MSLRIVYTDSFSVDVANQAAWYAEKQDAALAVAYAGAVDRTLEFLARHPDIGVLCGYRERELEGLRFYPVAKPFQRHLIYYQRREADLVAFRVVAAARDRPRRLLDAPG